MVPAIICGCCFLRIYFLKQNKNVYIITIIFFTFGINNPEGFKKLSYAMQRSWNGR